jgi:lipopolysaccharide export system permease protein
MRSAGISLWRICVPYLAAGFLLSVAMFWISEHLAPTSQDRERRIRARYLPENSEEQWIQSLNFRNARDNRIWTIGAYNPDTSEMSHPQVDWRLPDGSRRTLIARAAIRTNDIWQFSNVQFFVYPAGRPEIDTVAIRTNVMAMPEFTETPADIRVLIKFSRMNAVSASKRAHLSLTEIDYIEKHLELNPRDRAIVETQRQARMAQPWTCLIVALIAIPFGAASGRRNVFIGVAISIFICFAYMILQPLGLALANGQFVPPALGAWFPNALFAATGLWLTNRVK